MREGALWSIRVPVAADVPGGVAAVEAALEPFSIALSTFEVGAAVWQVEALAAKRPDAGQLAAALFGLPAPAASSCTARTSPSGCAARSPSASIRGSPSAPAITRRRAAVSWRSTG